MELRFETIQFSKEKRFKFNVGLSNDHIATNEIPLFCNLFVTGDFSGGRHLNVFCLKN